MYPVSEEFLEAIGENCRKCWWSGCITTTDGDVYNFTNEDILKGSSYISRQCSGNTEIELGTVYAAELAITLFLDIDRYTLSGAEVKIYYTLVLGDGTEETIPMGVFEVVEANRHIKTLELKAYDYMLRFDVSVDTSQFSGWQNYSLVVDICDQVNVGLATTETEYKALAGASYGFELYEPNDITTYRDLLFYLAQMLGCVAQINRFGELELLSHKKESCYTIPSEQRFSSSYSDYITKYTSITYQDMIVGETYTQTKNPDDGLNVDLGANPFLQATETSGGDFMAGYRLWDVLNALSKLQYTPFTATTIGNPALDPMDVVCCTGGHADDDAVSCVTHITYNIGGRQILKCVGSNPRLAAAKSNIQKAIDSATSGTSGSSGSGGCDCIDQSIVYLHYTNYTAYTINSTPIAIISKDFTAIYDTTVMFHATVVMNVTGVDSTADLTISYKINESTDVFSDVFEAEKALCNGKETLTLFFCASGIVKETINQLKVELKISSGTVTIEEKKIRATLQGQYLQEEDGYWNGMLEISDQFGDIPIVWEDFSVDSFGAELEIQERIAGEKEEQYQYVTVIEDIKIDGKEMDWR